MNEEEESFHDSFTQILSMYDREDIIKQQSERSDVYLMHSIAGAVHWIWAHWMRHFYNTAQEFTGEKITSYTVDKELAKDWKRKASVNYLDLIPDEQESDLKLAKQIIDDWRFNPYTGEKL